MALTVTIGGTTTIQQGRQTVLTATVTDTDGNTPPGTLTYAWMASRGSFDGATNTASVTYEADFTDTSDVDVDISCAVSRAADANPTVSTGSLTAMTELGITGQILNMYISETEDSTNGNNKVIYRSSSPDSTLDPGSDDQITDDINAWRVQYHAGNDWFILNNGGSGDLNAFFENNTVQSVYLIFSDGAHFEITNALHDNGGSAWVRWDVTSIAALATKLDDIGADDTLLVGVGDTGSIGLEADSGTGMATVMVTVSAPAPLTTLHSSLFFKSPINYDGDRVTEHGTSTVVSEITDNDYRTFSTVLDVDIDVSDNGNVTTIDYIFIKAKGDNIAYSFTPTGGTGMGFTNRTIPTTITNHEGTDVSTIVSGFTHELFPLPASVTASSVRLTFTGTNVEVYAVMLLQSYMEIAANSRYTAISFNKVDRSGILQQSNEGQVRRHPAIANARFKWQGDYRCIFTEDSVPTFMNLVENNLNGTLAMEFSRHPARVFLMAFPALRMANGYLGPVRSAGEFVEFQVAER